MKRALIAIALSGIALLLLLRALPPSQPEIAVERDLTYAKVAETELKLDLAMPKAGEGRLPAVVFLHGEGWRAGNRGQMRHFIEGMARMGYVGVAAGYRLVPVAHFPAQVEDCKAAVRWLRANAAKYRIDSEHMGVVGFSAGGYLAAMLGVTGSHDGFDGTGGNAEQSAQVQAVVSFFGPADFSARNWPKDLETEIIVPFLGGSFADKADRYKSASPINYVTKDAPPFLFFHGTDDKLVPVDQSIRFAEKLRLAGVPTEMVALEGEGHGFTDAGNQRSMQRMLDFLAKRLKE